MPWGSPMSRFMTLSLMALVLAAQSTAAGAQAARSSGGDQALKRAQYMLRLLNDEKRELEGEIARIEDDKKALQQEVDKLTARNGELESRLEQSGEANERLVERIHSDAAKYRELLGRYREAVKSLEQANADNRFMVRAVEEREAWIAKCRKRNEGLFAANRDLLARYKAKGFATTEWILGLERVKLENEVQEYRFRIEDLQVRKYVASDDYAPRVRTADQGIPGAGGEEMN